MKDLYVVVRQNLENEEDFALVYNNKYDVDVTQNFLYTDLKEAQDAVKEMDIRWGSEEKYKVAKLSWLD